MSSKKRKEEREVKGVCLCGWQGESGELSLPQGPSEREIPSLS